ncbi:hypothetical protein Tco_0321083 [Tanacetum coccineum]
MRNMRKRQKQKGTEKRRVVKRESRRDKRKCTGKRERGTETWRKEGRAGVKTEDKVNIVKQLKRRIWQKKKADRNKKQKKRTERQRENRVKGASRTRKGGRGKRKGRGRWAGAGEDRREKKREAREKEGGNEIESRKKNRRHQKTCKSKDRAEESENEK